MDRNRKRPDAADHLPADKRACSSAGFRPSTSSSAVMDEPSPANYVSCHSDESDNSESDHSHDDEYMDHHRCSPSRVKFQRLVDAISAGGADDPSAQLVALSELCEFLSFCVEDALAFVPIEAGVPALVRLAGAEGYPDAALLAARALTYLCDAMPRSADALVRHGAVSTLCSRLLTIEYLDLAEQCLQALEKISKKQPVPCLQAGTITAVLSYIDFFSTSIQRVALSTVANICKKLPLDCSHLVLESVPTICNILQYEDRKLIETAAICLIRIAECFYTSTEILDELCKHGVINQVLQLLSAGQTTLGQTTYKGLVGFLTKLAGGSLVATKTLYGLNLSCIWRGMLVASDFSNCPSYTLPNDSQSSQVHEILKLLHQLIPSVACDVEDLQMVLAKEKILIECPMFIHQLSVDLLPLLMEVVNSGASFSVCYGCVSVINNAVYFCSADELLELTKTTNISSFLAGLLTRNEHHILYLALKIIGSLLQKLPSVFTCSFIKEGVIYAVDTLLALEDPSQSVAHKSTLSQPSESRLSSGDASRCLCYAFSLQKSSPSNLQTCRVGKDSVLNIARQIKTTSFADESAISEVALTENFQKLRTLCAILCDSGSGTLNNNCSIQSENYLSSILDQVLRELRGGDGMSTFEFIESGIVRTLSCYLTNGKYLHGEFDDDDLKGHFLSVRKRLQIFTLMSMARVSESCEDVLLTLLIRKLQSALSSIENFPVILSHAFKPRNSYVDIPLRRCTVYPCLKVRFVKEEGDESLCAYDDVLTVEACSSFKDIERFLWPKISKRKAYNREHQAGDDRIHTNTSSERKCSDVLNPELLHISQESWSSSSEVWLVPPLAAAVAVLS